MDNNNAINDGVKDINKINKSENLGSYAADVGSLFFFKRYSNIYLVLSNYKMGHIATFTGGNCQLGKSKKKKISPFNMLNLVKNLKVALLKHNIKFLNFYLKQRFSRHFFNLKKVFKLNEIKVHNYIFLLYKSYNKSRKRNVRRI